MKEKGGDTEEWEGDKMEGREKTEGGKEGERMRDGQSCLCWSTQVSVLFDEDEVKC